MSSIPQEEAVNKNGPLGQVCSPTRSKRTPSWLALEEIVYLCGQARFSQVAFALTHPRIVPLCPLTVER